jgi:type III secretion protein V
MMTTKVDKTAALNRIATFLGRFHDLGLALWVVLIIAFLIMPVPPPVVDLLITLNFAVTFVLLMLSLYVPSALSLSTFPTLLLFTTLFRLALNITTTRQILLHADAGRIIYTFGHFVVGGNYIVGAVVFLIITIVQFVVIAKGAERVAEVSARFTLDGMPGKQMSIDGDLRTQAIDQKEARKRRQNLEDESKLYGAMDGAMKFVKGDAIAGLIITVINIIGGICIGAFQKGMPMVMATHKYTILTIGDGLVSQIPALLICITAGIIVTRVDTREASGHLAGEIIHQVISKPRALMIGGCILALQAFVPGFPKMHFFILSLLIAGSGFLIAFLAQKRTQRAMEKQIETDLSKPPPVHLPEQIALTEPLAVEISAAEADKIPLVQLEEQFEIIGRKFYLQTGVPFPGARARFTGQLPEGTYRVLIYDVPLYSGRLFRNKLLVPVSMDRLLQLEIQAAPAGSFAGIDTAAWVDTGDRVRLEAAGLPYWDAIQIISNHLAMVLHKHAVEFLDVSEVRRLVDLADEHYGTLVQEVKKTLPLQTMVNVFKYLVREDVSIRNVKSILECLVEHGGKEKNPLQLAEHSRRKLRRQILHQYCDEQGTLNVVLLHPELETLLQENLRQTPEGIFIDAPKHVIDNLINKVAAEIKRAPLKKLTILTSSEVRHHLRNLVEKVLPDVPVLARVELTPEVKLMPLANIEAS